MASTVSPAETTGAFSSNGDTRASTASPVASMPPPPTTPPTSVCSDYAPSSPTPIMGMKWYFVTKIVLTYCEKMIGLQPFKSFSRSLEKFIQTV